MIRPVFDEATTRYAIRARQEIADGPGDLSSVWLTDGRVAIAEESGALLDPGDTSRLQNALELANVEELIAISNDPLLDQDQVFELRSVATEMDALSWEMAGINTLLIPKRSLELAILCTVDDFRLVAGPREFVLSYAGDAVASRRRFVDFLEGHFEAMQPVLRRAARYMDWIGESG